MFKGLRTVSYHVTDIERAKRWYSEVLGIAPYFDRPFYVGFSVSGYELGLQPDGADVTVGTNVGVFWGVDDVAAAIEHLVRQGARIHSSPEDVGDGITVASVMDPWGNLFGVIRDPHFKL